MSWSGRSVVQSGREQRSTNTTREDERSEIGDQIVFALLDAACAALTRHLPRYTRYKIVRRFSRTHAPIFLDLRTAYALIHAIKVEKQNKCENMHKRWRKKYNQEDEGMKRKKKKQQKSQKKPKTG